MIGDLIAVVAVVAGLIAVTRLRDLGPRADPGRRAVATAVLGVAAGAAILSPGVTNWVERVSGVANLGEPLARSALMVAALGAQAIFLLASPLSPGPRRSVRRRIIAFVAALAAFWTAFAVAPRYPRTGTYYLSHGTDPWVAAMLLIALGFCGWAFLDLLGGWRRWGIGTRGSLRTGLALMAIGALAGCGWVAMRLTGQVAVLTDHHDLERFTVVPGVALAALAALATVTGVVWPGVHERVAAARRWVRAYRATGRLYPLWHDLIGVRPAVALEPATGAVRDRLRLRDVSWRLYRRIIEIRDARLALRPYLAASRLRARRRLASSTTAPPSSLAAAVEGYALADAVQVAAAHPDAPAPAPSLSRQAIAEPTAPMDPVSIEEEAVYLSDVADYYRAATAATPSRHDATPLHDAEGPA